MGKVGRYRQSSLVERGAGFAGFVSLSSSSQPVTPPKTTPQKDTQKSESQTSKIETESLPSPGFTFFFPFFPSSLLIPHSGGPKSNRANHATGAPSNLYFLPAFAFFDMGFFFFFFCESLFRCCNAWTCVGGREGHG